MNTPTGDVIAEHAAEQLPLLTDDDLRLIDSALDASGDKRPFWWSKQLNVGVCRTLYHRHHGVGLFVAWNLARMGAANAHDLSADQVARELGITREHVQNLWKAATATGDLYRRREPGHGRRLVTRPGVIVELHQPPVTVGDPPAKCQRSADTSTPKRQRSADTLKTPRESSVRAARLGKPSRPVPAEDHEPPRPAHRGRFCDGCGCEPCYCHTDELGDVGERIDTTSLLSETRETLRGDRHSRLEAAQAEADRRGDSARRKLERAAS